MKKTVNAVGIKKLLTAVHKALPPGLKRKAKVAHNKRAEEMGYCPHSINVRFKKNDHNGFSLEGWDSARWYIHKGAWRGLKLSLNGAKYRYNGREYFNYPIRKDDTIAIDKIIKAITRHQEEIKKAEKRNQAEKHLQEKLKARLEAFASLLDETDLTSEIFGSGAVLVVRNVTGRVTISISRDLETERPFQLDGTYLYYTAESILELLLTMFRLAEVEA